MATTNDSMPRISRQPPTVDFIDNQLPKHHPMFQNPPTHYDPSSDRYVGSASPAKPMASGNSNTLTWAPDPVDPADDNWELPPRPADTDIKAMTFWDWLFPLAMADLALKPAPTSTKPEHSIRHKTDWDSVYETLEKARGEYRTEDGKRKLFRKVRRRAADQAAPVAEAARTVSALAPNSLFSTPLLGAVVMMLDALKTTADLRKQVVDGFDGLVHLFSDVELFLGTFPRDENIKRASLTLTVSTLEAIEQAIKFFTTSGFVRAANAALTGPQYGEQLRQSLAQVKTNTQGLMTEALKSHILNFRLFGKEITRLQNGTLRLRKSNSGSSGRMAKHIAYLRSREPSPLPRSRTPNIDTYISQQALRRMLDTSDIHLADIAVVTDTKSRLPAKERGQAEQIINRSAFRRWIVSPVSAKLLVHWDLNPSKTRSGVSPLSGLCATMLQALAAQPRFISLLWFGGRHVDRISMGEIVGENDMLRSLTDQLLRQFDFDMRYFQNPIDPSCSQDELLGLFEWLIRQIPRSHTVCCVIDGVALLERGELVDESLPVLSKLVQLVNDPSIPAAIKLLLTSTPATTIVRGVFEDEGLILNVNALPRQSLPSSDDRVMRELGASVWEGEKYM
ncbi:hypothetical protein BJY00DRAFT_321098 [Aspergillus carlsbadensis]|nr:hypothetical protein BJY00DRAFT_321098 [Aspergillus carlsbadensis]